MKPARISALPTCGAMRRRHSIYVHYNSDGFISEIIDSVGRKIGITSEIVQHNDPGYPELGVPGMNWYSKHFEFRLYDTGSDTGKLLYKTTSLYDYTNQDFTLVWLSSMDENEEQIKSTRFTYAYFPTTIDYNLYGGFVLQDDLIRQTVESYTSILSSFKN